LRMSNFRSRTVDPVFPPHGFQKNACDDKKRAACCVSRSAGNRNPRIPDPSLKFPPPFPPLIKHLQVAYPILTSSDFC
jgi:hypothetical protein